VVGGVAVVADAAVPAVGIAKCAISLLAKGGVGDVPGIVV
jgi:hypothetical protein